MNDRIIAACDGAAKGNPGPAAWAYVVADSAGVPQRWQAGPLGHSTNNVGELTALERLLAATDAAVPLEVRLDSTYTRDSVTKWLKGWKRNGWKTAAGKPVANQELIQRIDELLDGRDVTFVYVPAHQVDGDPLNAVADKAASDAARTQEAAGGTAADLPVPDPAASSPARGGASRGGAARSGARSTGAATPAAAKRRSSGGAPTLSARFPGTCPCSRPYAKGDKITKVGGSWGHPECATAAQD
ncbi:ribonuclease HI [Streptomyces sp. XY431]|uniref:ribonuclease H family protein n=1 Tax=Streptomyces sp. XY431 TaxID=1415562 RepID=UPI0006AF0F38|nr:ribonuclease H [Streptomyces sp. XY431]KOV32307.1 ribonuclease HI [Streptomyces sp. XY431]